MKRFFTLLLALMLLLSLAACSSGDDDKTPSGSDPQNSQQQGQEPNSTPAPGSEGDKAPSGDTENPGNSEAGNNAGIPFDGEVFDIADDNIIAYADGTELEGDEATEAKANIPAELKKYAGEIDIASSSLTLNTTTGDYQYTFVMNLIVPNIEQCEELVRYYKSLDGTIIGEDSMGGQHLFAMNFSWGEIQCQYGDTLIKVQAMIK